MKERETEKLVQSYVYRDDGTSYFVSTAYRSTFIAAAGGERWYYETLAWKLKDGTTEREDPIIADNSGAHLWERALLQHMEVVRQLQLNGKFRLEEED